MHAENKECQLCGRWTTTAHLFAIQTPWRYLTVCQKCAINSFDNRFTVAQLAAMKASEMKENR
jgi:ribosome-binding protein aMBF1 (putative translation factor)